LACAATIIGLSIAGLVYSETVITKHNKARCAMYLMVNEAEYGASDEFSQEYTWIGSDGIEQRGYSTLINIQNNWRAFNKISEIEIEHKDDNFKRTDDFVGQLSSKLSIGNVKNPEAEGNMKIQIFEKIGGDYPFVKILKEEVKEFKETIVPNLIELKKEAANINQENRFESFQSSIRGIGYFDSRVKSIKGKAYDFLDIIEIVFKYIRLGMVIYYALIMGLTLIILLGGVLFVKRLPKCCWHVRNFGCVSLVVFMIIGYLLAAILLPASVLLIDICDIVNLDELKEKGAIETLKEIEICLVGDGDLYTNKGFGSNLDFAKRLARGLNSASLIYENGKMKYPAADALIEDYKTIANKEPYRASPDIFPTSDPKLGNIPNGHRVVWFGCDGPQSTSSESCINRNGPICVSITKCHRSNDEQAIRSEYSGNADFTNKLLDHIKFANDVKDRIEKVLRHIERAGGGADDNYYDKMDEDTEDNGVREVVEEVNRISYLDKLIEDTEMLSTRLKEGLNCKLMRESLNRVHDSFCGAVTQQIVFVALLAGLISSISLLLVITMVCLNRHFLYSEASGSAPVQRTSDSAR